MQKLLFPACFFICANCFAQQYPFVHYTPKDGLVNSRVRKAYQDSKGRMYFLTFGGLSVYDGTRFTNYTVQNGLAADMVNDVLEMGDDSIWIACNINKLNYLSHGKIKTFKTADGFYPTINKFIKSKEGPVYVVADQGLFLFRQNRFIRLPFTNNDGLDISKFLIDGIEWNDWLFIHSDNVLNGNAPENFFAFNKKKGEVIAGSENKLVSAVCIGNNHQVYISDNNGILSVLDTIALLSHKILFLPVPGQNKTITSGISYMHFDNKKNFWLFLLNKKIVRIDSTGSMKEFSMANGLSSNNFNSVFLDQEGSAWITMNGSGVDKLVNDNIELYDQFHGIPVNAIYTDSMTDSVYLYASSLKKVFIAYNDNVSGYKSSGTEIFPNAFYVFSGKVYISNAKKLFLFNQNNQGENTLVYRDTLESSFGNIYPDPYQNMVLSGLSYLTVLIADKPVYRFPVNYLSDQIGFDKQKRLWAASRAGELYILKINPGEPDHYLQLIKYYKKVFPEFSARSLTVDHSGNVWIGTRVDGLYRFQFDEKLEIKSFQHYTTKEGLSDNFIIQLTCDVENNIWASTSSGVDKISYVNDTIRIENITRNNNIYEQVVKTFVNKKGVAWSYTGDGKLIRIGKRNNAGFFRPSLFITGLKIGNTVNDNVSGPASFSYKENSFTISAAAPSFYAEQQVKYSYLLQGSGNDQWSEASNNSTFNFINLNPGEYTLKIKAIFPGGRYPDQVIDYAFIIHPPWWQTVLFRLLAASLIMGLLIIASRLYYRRKLERQRIASEKQQAVEKERTRIATDIHDDLGSGLSRIRYLGEMVKLKTLQQENILPDIEKIAGFSDEMVDKMNEIVWALNEKNDSLEAIISYTRSFAAEYLSNNNIICTVSLPDTIPDCIIKGETRRNIFLSVKECLHNIVKHAGATETIILIDISSDLIIRIHDDGKGINWENTRPFSNGILNIKKRMKDAGGTAVFKNENGTTVVLKIPLL
jgi:signal transduction histidine kinase/ligand-binding sensor domain-containing protein